MVINKNCFYDEDSKEFLKTINYLSNKVLLKCAVLSKSLFMKYLVYNATCVYESDKKDLVAQDKSNDRYILIYVNKTYIY